MPLKSNKVNFIKNESQIDSRVSLNKDVEETTISEKELFIEKFMSFFQGKIYHNHHGYMIYHIQNENVNLFSFFHLCFHDISILPF